MRMSESASCVNQANDVHLELLLTNQHGWWRLWATTEVIVYCGRCQQGTVDSIQDCLDEWSIVTNNYFKKVVAVDQLKVVFLVNLCALCGCEWGQCAVGASVVGLCINLSTAAIFPNMTKLGKSCRVVPIHTEDVERTFSWEGNVKGDWAGHSKFEGFGSGFVQGMYVWWHNAPQELTKWERVLHQSARSTKVDWNYSMPLLWSFKWFGWSVLLALVKRTRISEVAG